MTDTDKNLLDLSEQLQAVTDRLKKRAETDPAGNKHNLRLLQTARSNLDRAYRVVVPVAQQKYMAWSTLEVEERANTIIKAHAEVVEKLRQRDAVHADETASYNRKLAALSKDRVSEKERADQIAVEAAKAQHLQSQLDVRTRERDVEAQNALRLASEAHQFQSKAAKLADEYRKTAIILGLPDPTAPADGHPTEFEEARAKLAADIAVARNSEAARDAGAEERAAIEKAYVERVEKRARSLSALLPPGSYNAEGALEQAALVIADLKRQVSVLTSKVMRIEREVDDVSLERDQMQDARDDALTRVGELDGELRRVTGRGADSVPHGSNGGAPGLEDVLVKALSGIDLGSVIETLRNKNS
jgi:hypothetical protein